MQDDGNLRGGGALTPEDQEESSLLEPYLSAAPQQRKTTHREDSTRIRNHLLRGPSAKYLAENAPVLAEPLAHLDAFSDHEMGVLDADGRQRNNSNEERDTPSNTEIAQDIEIKWNLGESGQLSMIFEMDLSNGNAAEILAAARKEAGLTKVAVAKAMGVNEKTVRKIESGEQDPTSEMVGKYAKALGLVPVLGLAAAG